MIERHKAWNRSAKCLLNPSIHLAYKAVQHKRNMASQSLSASVSAPWKTVLQRSLSQNSSLPNAKYMQLATVRPDGRPANRTVVFRGFLNDTDQITFVTDRRSSKISDLAANRNVEVCWYFPSSREQYRLSGVVDIVSEDHTDQQLLQARQAAWARMSDAGRSQFLWPQPGQPRMPMDESLFLVPAPESAGAAVADFCLGIVQVHEVDHVDLFTNKRTIYSSSQQPATAAAAAAGSEQHRQWSAQSVNP